MRSTDKASPQPQTGEDQASTPAPPRFGTPLLLLITLLAGASLCLVVLVALEGPGAEEALQRLPGPAVAEIRRAAYALRVQLRLTDPDVCDLGSICQPGQKRPLLPDGTPSHTIWDLPRKLMRESFAQVEREVPGARVSYMWEEPLVVYFDGVLGDDEIDLILKTATPRFSKSMVVSPSGKVRPDMSRTSDTAWIYITEGKKFAAIIEKVAKLAGFGLDNTEHMGVNRYEVGQFFNPHHDFIDEKLLAEYGEFPNCQRSSSVLIYLSDVEEGGESMFFRKDPMDGTFAYDPENPDHLAVKPKRGRVLVWYNMHPFTEKLDHRTLHGGSPVKEGTKIAATVFLRNCSRTTNQDYPRGPAAEKPKEEL